MLTLGYYTHVCICGNGCILSHGTRYCLGIEDGRLLCRTRGLAALLHLAHEVYSRVNELACCIIFCLCSLRIIDYGWFVCQGESVRSLSCFLGMFYLQITTSYYNKKVWMVMLIPHYQEL